MASPAISREVRADLTCRQCGYNLRGMTLDRSCPECGTPVEFSARGFQLRFAEPGWIKQMRTGTSLMLWAVVVFALSLVFALFAAMGNLRTGGIAGPVLVIGWGIALTMWWFGVMCVTTIEPRAVDAEPPVNVRRVARIAGSCAVLSWVVVYVFISSHSMFGYDRGLGALACGVLSLISMVTLLLHMRKLADRTISGYLRDWITSYLYTACVAIVLVGVLIVVSGAAHWEFGLCIGCLALVCAVFLSIWLILLMAEFNRELEHCVRYSESELQG